VCAVTPNTREVLITLPARDPYHFAFDDVLPEETEQGEVFESELCCGVGFGFGFGFGFWFWFGPRLDL